MLREVVTQFKIASLLLVLFSLITGLLYPVLVTAIAQVLFPVAANGSLVKKDGVLIGSLFIGQPYTDPKYFWGRPSATVPYPYNAAASAGSNLGPMNPDLVTVVNSHIATLENADPQNLLAIPIDLVTASASGLDPDISPYAALYQVHRVAAARGWSEDKVKQLVLKNSQHRFAFILGEPRVNVLTLNLALDEAEKQTTTTKE